MTQLEKLIELCDRPEMGVEQINAEMARSGEFDDEALACWLLTLHEGIDCERAARRPEIADTARRALDEMRDRFLRKARSAGYSERIVNEVRHICR